MLKYFPVNPKNKQPLVKGWQNFEGQPTGTYGVVLTADYLIVDIDPRNGGDETEALFEMLGYLPATKIVTTASGGRHYYYTKSPDISTRKKVDKFKGVDFLSVGAYVVGEGSVINDVEYISNNLPIAEMSSDLLAEILAIKKEREIKNENKQIEILELEEIQKILDCLPAEYYNDYHKWLTIGMCLHHCGDGSQKALDIWDTWSRSSAKYQIDLCSNKWRTFKKGKKSEVTIGTLLSYAMQHGYQYSQAGDDFNSLDRPKGRDTFDSLTELQNWVYVVNVRHFFNIVDKRDFDVDTMRLYYRRTLPKGDTISIILQSKYLTIVDAFDYIPGAGDFFETESMTYVNTWRGSRVQAKKGDAQVFENHLKWLLDDDWSVLRDWMAWCVQKPAQRLKWAIVLTGGQGIGKSYLGEILAKLIGLHNVSYPSNEGIHDKYTGWAARKELVIVNELMSTGRRDLMNRLKQLLTEEYIPVREMRMDEYEIKAYFKMLIFSNYDSPLIIDTDDRRFCILKSFKSKNTNAYYDNLWEWSLNNLGVIKDYLLSIDLTNFNSENAPNTFAKTLLLQDVSQGDDLNIIDEWVQSNNRTLFTLAEISALLQPTLDDMTYLDNRQISHLLRRKYQFFKRISYRSAVHRLYFVNAYVQSLKKFTDDQLIKLLHEEQTTTTTKRI